MNQHSAWMVLYKRISKACRTGKDRRSGRAALVDDLTGAYSRNGFYDQLRRMLGCLGGPDTLLIKVNIRRFHDINVNFGYDIGDALLIQLARRFKELPGAVTGRLSGDEFAVAVPLSDPNADRGLVMQAKDLLIARFEFPSVTIDLRYAMGFAKGTAKDDAISLLRKAGIALHESRTSALGEVKEFNRDMAIKIENHGRLIRELQNALENGEFRLYFQPKVELATKKIVGAEALLRWDNPVFGIQPPTRFIPIAEESGLIVEIGAWALRRAVAFAARINRGRSDPLTIAVNVSPVQFDYMDVAQLLRNALEETGAQPAWLILELTESTLANRSAIMIEVLQRIRGLGVALSIDDFGTGYSSLGYLDSFPVSEIKIDRSFISELDRNRSRRVLVDAMIRLGRELDISVLAEGAETEGEVSTLRQLGCTYAQGYFFGLPMPEDVFETLAATHGSEQDFVRNAVLVEDDPLLREIIGDTLEHLGWAVMRRASAEEALQDIETAAAPGLLVTDVNLGAGLDGFQFCKVARSHWPDAGMIIISGRVPSAGKVEALGPKHVFLSKPVKMPDLEVAIARVLSASG